LSGSSDFLIFVDCACLDKDLGAARMQLSVRCVSGGSEYFAVWAKKTDKLLPVSCGFIAQ
jgi:hypothetical protein